MKLSEDVLLEIVDIVRQGIVEGKDVSELLRELDLDVPVIGGTEAKLTLSARYKSAKGRVV